MSGKGKQVEVTSARNRLDATLQHLVDRNEESTVGEEIDVLTYHQADPPPSIKLNLSPKKATTKLSRKRKRRADSSDNDASDEHTYIMKLFDRSVDMAQFPEDTPLYPVCRAWIRNRPHDKTLGSLCDRLASPEKPKDDDEGNENFIWEMPPPIKSEDGCLYDLRVPEPLPQTDEPLDIHIDPNSAPSTEKLLLNHMVRWKHIRNRWHESSKMNEMQYASSIQLLKNLFESCNPMENT